MATTSKPGGMAVILSPWLIHTGSSSPTSPRPASSGDFALDMDVGAAELAGVAALHRAAQLGAHGHFAVADAQHRHAELEDRPRCGDGLSASCGAGRAAREDHRLGREGRPASPPRPGRRGGSRNRPRSRARRRAMSWVTWLPKSTISTLSWPGALMGGGLMAESPECLPAARSEPTVVRRSTRWRQAGACESAGRWRRRWRWPGPGRRREPEARRRRRLWRRASPGE